MSALADDDNAISARDQQLLDKVKRAQHHLSRVSDTDPIARGGFARGTLHPDTSCTGKRLYRTPEFSQKAADFATRQFGLPTRFYKCVFCQGYHLTTRREHSPHSSEAA